MREGQEFSPGERDTLIEKVRVQRREEPTLPSLPRLAGNLAKAVVKHLGNGLKTVEVSTFQRRLDQCNDCGLRVKNRCTHESCGCFIDKKAWWASEECPLDKWLDV
jgi:hypothetical protein